VEELHNKTLNESWSNPGTWRLPTWISGETDPNVIEVDAPNPSREMVQQLAQQGGQYTTERPSTPPGSPGEALRRWNRAYVDVLDVGGQLDPSGETYPVDGFARPGGPVDLLDVFGQLQPTGEGRYMTPEEAKEEVDISHQTMGLIPTIQDAESERGDLDFDFEDIANIWRQGLTQGLVPGPQAVPGRGRTMSPEQAKAEADRASTSVKNLRQLAPLLSPFGHLLREVIDPDDPYKSYGPSESFAGLSDPDLSDPYETLVPSQWRSAEPIGTSLAGGTLYGDEPEPEDDVIKFDPMIFNVKRGEEQDREYTGALDVLDLDIPDARKAAAAIDTGAYGHSHSSHHVPSSRSLAENKALSKTIEKTLNKLLK